MIAVVGCNKCVKVAISEISLISLEAQRIWVVRGIGAHLPKLTYLRLSARWVVPSQICKGAVDPPHGYQVMDDLT